MPLYTWIDRHVIKSHINYMTFYLNFQNSINSTVSLTKLVCYLKTWSKFSSFWNILFRVSFICISYINYMFDYICEVLILLISIPNELKSFVLSQIVAVFIPTNVWFHPLILLSAFETLSHEGRLIVYFSL